jgi:hypothetical protein
MTESKNYGTPTLDALVELGRSIRRDWHVAGLRTAIRDALARDQQPSLAELAYAIVRCAENPAISSPAVIALNGPHWRMQTRESEAPKAAFCRDCRDTHMPGTCTGTGPPVSLDKHAERMAQLRAAHADAGTTWHGRLCSCGADSRTCQRHELADA